MKIEHMNHDKSGEFRLVTESNNDVIGKMTYLWENEEVMIIEHTEIDPAYQGKNLGEKLVDSAVEYARKNSKKIIPLCPFANAVFRRHTQYNDVLTTNE